MRSREAFAIGMVLSSVWACTPALQAPNESLRLTGVVEEVAAPEASPTAAPESVATPVERPGKSRKREAKLRSFPTLRQLPLGVAVYEACSTQLYFFKKCPGRFLAEAKLVKPGPFVVEFDTKVEEVVVFGFRGFLGPDQEQESCAELKVPVAEAAKPLTLKLEKGACSIKLERRYG